MTLPVHESRFRQEHFSTHFRPRQPGGQAYLVALADTLLPELGFAQHLAHITLADLSLFGSCDDNLLGYLSADVCDLALQVAHSGLARVLTDEFQKCPVRVTNLLRLQPVGLDLLPDQEALRDLEFFQLGVTRQIYDFHAVLQGPRNRVQHVRGRDEHHHGQIELGVQVMIHEPMVLFRVQHFEQRGRRVPAEIHAHLVHFIEHEDGVPRSGFLHHLNDLARKGADVGTPVAPNFRFVPYAAQRQPDKFPSGRVRDRPSQRSLAHAWRPDKAQDGPLRFLDQTAHRQEFQYALFDLFQTVMVFLEDLRGVFHVPDLARLLVPGHCQQPVQVRSRYGGFCRHGRHHLEALNFFHRLLVRVLGHLGGFDLLLQLIQLGLLVFAPQLLLDRLHLFVEIVFLLGALHLALHASLDVPVYFDLLDLDLNDLVDLFHALREVHHFEELLLLFNAYGKVGAYVVSLLGRLHLLHRIEDRVVVDVVAELGELLEHRLEPLDQEVGFGAGARCLLHQLHICHKVAGFRTVTQGLPALYPFHQHLDVAVVQLDALDDVGDGAHFVAVVSLGIIHGGIDLRGQKDALGAFESELQRTDRRGAPDHKRDHHVGEHHHIPDRDHGQTFHCFRRMLSTHR